MLAPRGEEEKERAVSASTPHADVARPLSLLGLDSFSRSFSRSLAASGCILLRRQHSTLRRMRSTSDAYATIVVHDGPHACTAAVLARALKRVDPSRRRVALVDNISAETEAVLLADGLWEVQRMEQPFVLPQSALWPRKPPIWGFQAQLWTLPFRQVLFFDADHIPLARLSNSTSNVRSGARQRLLGLWSQAPETPLAALGEGDAAHGCFNSGMMRIRPDLATFARMKAMAARMRHVELASNRDELDGLRVRCPTGWNLDQPLLNHYFPKGTWSRLSQWRVGTPYSLVGAPGICEIGTVDALASYVDSYHYMHPVRPWQQHISCKHNGTRCLPDQMLAPYQQAHKLELRHHHQWREFAVSCPKLWQHVFNAWFGEYKRLPAKVRATCRSRVLTSSNGQRAPLALRKQTKRP